MKQPLNTPVTKSGGDNPAALPGSELDANYSLPFFCYLTIPANTSIAVPTSQTIKLPRGRINRIRVGIPAGVQGLAKVQIWRGAYQIFPLPEGVWLTSDDAVLDYSLTHNVYNEPFEVEIRGYNDDDTYSHTIWVSVEISGFKKDLPPALLQFFEYMGV